MIRVGNYIQPDGWKIGNTLAPGLPGLCSFYLRTNNPIITHLACNIEPTGRVLRRRFDAYYMRVRIIFIGDGEPDVVCGGWILAD